MQSRFPVSTDRRFRNGSQRPDHGTQERWRHSGRVYELTDRAGVLVARVTGSTVLDGLFEKNLINMKERDAALLLKRDYLMAKLEQHTTSSYSGVRSTTYNPYSPALERTDEQEDAYMRWRDALCAVSLRFRNALVSAVCQEMHVRCVHDLKCALMELVKHYQI